MAYHGGHTALRLAGRCSAAVAATRVRMSDVPPVKEVWSNGALVVRHRTYEFVKEFLSTRVGQTPIFFLDNACLRVRGTNKHVAQAHGAEQAVCAAQACVCCHHEGMTLHEHRDARCSACIMTRVRLLKSALQRRNVLASVLEQNAEPNMHNCSPGGCACKGPDTESLLAFPPGTCMKGRRSSAPASSAGLKQPNMSSASSFGRTWEQRKRQLRSPGARTRGSTNVDGSTRSTSPSVCKAAARSSWWLVGCDVQAAGCNSASRNSGGCLKWVP